MDYFGKFWDGHVVYLQRRSFCFHHSLHAYWIGHISNSLAQFVLIHTTGRIFTIWGAKGHVFTSDK